MKRLSAALVCLAILSLPVVSAAETLGFEGRIPSSRAVVRIPITLADPLSAVVVWSDSHAGGKHFDPITALWRDGVLVGETTTGRGRYRAKADMTGLTIETLAVGDYLLTISNYNNFANGSLLADGFHFDAPL